MNNSVINIPIEYIVPNINQPRKYFNEESISELAQSIETYGIIQPLSVRKVNDTMYEIVAGERRYRAAKKAGLDSVPAILINISESDSAVVALLENIQREDLNFIEQAEAFRNLIEEYSYTQEKLAQVIGKKQSTIANKLRLLKLDSKIRKMLLENNLTERHGRALLKLPTIDMQFEVLNEIIDKSLNVKKTEELIDKLLLNESKKEIAADGKKKIKGIFSPRVYMNTIKQVFDKYGIDAKYKSKEYDDYVKVVVTIPKKTK
ncbi:nucleoid occlusion protein [Clostridium tepidiprofundi DSM 19306]|uniref:Nucleoid occlusion protein n=1 Tax=Clostridium tepidiprofundi DSM 19306 TaxID=1121338 RepID=A0A151B2I2_9CLOT|nr:nucleoid occlusion protein [Clostridium tepidiprofundi]KYH34114.1 nucleoid occlusion protein [Clostridium tepidiprofundi DSM 19306]